LAEPDPAAVATPPIFIAFDVMYRDRQDLARLPLSARRIHLEDVIAGTDLGAACPAPGRERPRRLGPGCRQRL
jgi:ATP-dependent DNA ligase